MGEKPDRLHPEERGLDRVKADSPATQHLSPISLERDAVLSSVYRGVSDKQSKRVKILRVKPGTEEAGVTREGQKHPAIHRTSLSGEFKDRG